MKEKNKEKTIKLRIQKVKEGDIIGKPIIKLSPILMQNLGIKTGDVIAVKGKKESAAIVWSSIKQDQSLGFVQLDYRLRKNTDTNVDDMIKIYKVNAFIAQSVILAPTRMKFKTNPKFETFMKKKLINYPVSLEDIIYISIGIGGEIPFKVISLTPMGICLIKQETSLQISDIILSD